MSFNKICNSCQICRTQDRRPVNIRSAEGDIVTDTAVEEIVVLAYVADMTAQIRDVQLPQVNAIKFYGTLLRFIESHAESSQSTFPRAGSAKDSNLFARLNMQRDTIQSRQLAVRILEMHIFKAHRCLQVLRLDKLLIKWSLIRLFHQQIK